MVFAVPECNPDPCLCRVRYRSACGQYHVGDDRRGRAVPGESETRFAQIACYLPVGQGKTEEDIQSFRQGLDAKFTEQSLEAPENGSLYVDAYGCSAQVSLSTDYGSADVTAMGIGGDFFYFHPLQLRSGSYISDRDLMDDLVVLDEVMAWATFWRR